MNSNEWINVKNRLPPIVNETILISDGVDVYSGFFDSMHEWRMGLSELCEDLEFNVTHWMPLPDAPKDNI